MSRSLVAIGLAFALCAASLQAQDGLRRGKIKEVKVNSIIITGEVVARPGSDPVRQANQRGRDVRNAASLTRPVAANEMDRRVRGNPV